MYSSASRFGAYWKLPKKRRMGLADGFAAGSRVARAVRESSGTLTNVRTTWTFERGTPIWTYPTGVPRSKVHVVRTFVKVPEDRSGEHTSEVQSRVDHVRRHLPE